MDNRHGPKDNMNAEEQQVFVTSSVGSDTGRPIVGMTVDGVEVLRMEAGKAREIAHMLLAAAEAAVGDVFMVTFLTEKIGLELGQAVGVLREFRDWRTEKDIDAWGQP